MPADPTTPCGATAGPCIFPYGLPMATAVRVRRDAESLAQMHGLGRSFHGIGLSGHRSRQGCFWLRREDNRRPRSLDLRRVELGFHLQRLQSRFRLWLGHVDLRLLHLHLELRLWWFRKLRWRRRLELWL